MKRNTPKQIAPRLANGDKRVAAGNGLPPVVKYALSVIAAQEGKSRSWVMEQIVMRWAEDDPRLHRMLRGKVEYLPRKTPDPVAAPAGR